MPVLTTVITHATGDVYPASDWNTYNRDNVNYLIQAGADLASAGTIVTTNEFHAVTGVTTIDNLNPTTPVAGQRIRLWIKGGPLTIRNNGGGTGNIRMKTGADRTLAANEIVEFAYDATNSVWRETGPAAGSIVKYTTLIDIVNTVAEIDILQAAGYTIPGNTLGPNGVARVTICADVFNNTGGAANLVPRIYWGGTKIIDSGAWGVSSGAARDPWTIRFTLSNLGATNVQFLIGRNEFGGGGHTAVTAGIWASTGSEGLFASNGTHAVDTTANALLRVTVQPSVASASFELRVRESLIEFL